MSRLDDVGAAARGALAEARRGSYVPREVYQALKVVAEYFAAEAQQEYDDSRKARILRRSRRPYRRRAGRG